MERRVLLLGVGQVGQAVASIYRNSRRVIGTTRQPTKLFDLFHESIEPIVMPWPSADVIAPLAHESDVLVSFPPDGKTDSILASACMEAKSIVYISSTAVFGSYEGYVDDTTPVDPSTEPAKQRIEAEKIWRAVGANVLRAPAIYGPDSGLHKELQKGDYKMAGDGSRTISRIHVEDLATFVDAAFESGLQQETFVLGDMKPTTHIEVVTWLCERLGVPLPESASMDEVHYTRRANRAVDSSRARRELGVTLKYPTYKEGYDACLRALT